MLSNPLISGLTIYGGNPMEQADDCLTVAIAAKNAGLNICTYTGYTCEWLMEHGSKAQLKLLMASDVLVDGRFLMEQRSLAVPYRGSLNQRLIDVAASVAHESIILHDASHG